MTWVKVDDAFPEHDKVIEAGRHLGSNGCGRVLAIWLAGVCYCNRNLTDGRIPEAIVRTWILYDKRPIDVAEVMVHAKLLVKVDGGYRFHDYLDYQPSADKVKSKRAWDRDRKAKQKAEPETVESTVESARNPHGIRAEDLGFPQGAVVDPSSDQRPIDQRFVPDGPLDALAFASAFHVQQSDSVEELFQNYAEAGEIPRGIRADSTVESARIPSPPARPVPDLLLTQKIKITGAARRRMLRVEKSLTVLKAVVWSEVKAGLVSGETDPGDLLERVKVAAARARIDYASPESREYLHDQFGLALQRLAAPARRTA
jgi:hypothetical protein